MHPFIIFIINLIKIKFKINNDDDVIDVMMMIIIIIIIDDDDDVVVGGGGVVGSTIQPLTAPFELGPVLDVIPYVSADGFTIQMTIIPTLKEFIGYDRESAQLFQAQAQSVGVAAANPLTTTTGSPCAL